MPSSNRLSHGWYSASQAEANGSCLYLSPCGRPVRVSLITKEETTPSGWDDIIYMGTVSHFAGGQFPMGPEDHLFDDDEDEDFSDFDSDDLFEEDDYSSDDSAMME